MQLRLVPFFFAAAAAIAQSPEQTRVFTFAHTEAPQHVQEVLNGVRSIGGITKLAFDPEARALTISGSADQVAVATWLITEVDRPSGSLPKALLVRESSF